jgi:hypothetical protein
MQPEIVPSLAGIAAAATPIAPMASPTPTSAPGRRR